MVRVRPSSKEMLRQASLAQRKSMAAVVDDLIVDALSKQFATSDTRINAFLKGNV